MRYLTTTASRLAVRRFVLLTIFLFCGALSLPPAATPISRLDEARWRDRFQLKQEEEHRGPVDLVFFGDSITQQFERVGPPPQRDLQAVWQRFYGDRRALNLGFGGDTTANLLWRLDNGELDGIKPKVAVVLIGANDVSPRNHYSAADTIVGIETVVATLRQRLPATQVVLVAILPGVRPPSVLAAVAQVNRALAARYAGEAVPGVHFVDPSAAFMTGGQVDASLFRDHRLHPSAEGQARLAEALEPTLDALLSDRNHAH